MKIVLDTNVFISGIFFSGPPYQILKAWRSGHVKIVLSAEILDEYRRVGIVLAEQFPAINIGPILKLITAEAEFVQAPNLPEPVCDDPDDDKFLACAIAGDVNQIVSGDKHLLKVSGYNSLHVLTPRKFVDDHLLSQSV